MALETQSHFPLLQPDDVFVVNSSDVVHHQSLGGVVNSTTTTTISVDLELLLGPRRQHISTAVPMTVCLLLLTLTLIITVFHHPHNSVIPGLNNFFSANPSHLSLIHI